MAYAKASEVLPRQLLEAIQHYVDGAYLYIPRRRENRKRWGEGKEARRILREPSSDQAWTGPSAAASEATEVTSA